MHSYRAYLLDRHGHIFNLSADDDDAAKEHAALLTDTHAVELWDCGRKIAMFLPSRSH